MNPKPTTTTTADDVVVRIKKEPNSSSDEMKEYAETAMNELLGWYGYDGGGEEDDDDTETRPRTRSACDSSEPECSDSGGTPGGPWCGWCSRPMSDSGQATGAFCSELCFSQSRRASFKRNRTCDWCRHVRHTVAHVDVRDGSRHLQFCGDKCLNQYKMHIFCRETQAHLELHPHAHTTTVKTSSSGEASALITPELWLKDCKDKSPTSDRISSPSPLRNSSTLENKSIPISRRRLYSASRRSSSSSIGKRTHTITVPSQDADLEGPQDLSVRTRSPVEQSCPPKEPVASPKVTLPPTEPHNFHRLWPPLPPPVTVLVPYPIMIPVPIPLPLPIPIPLPEEILRRSASATSTTGTSTTTTAPGKTENLTPPERTKPVTRTLRKRKRPTGNGSDEQNNRKTVPA